MATGSAQKEDKIQKKPEHERKKRRNYVIEDEIMREIVLKEITTQIKFEQRWSFLRAENLDRFYEQFLEKNINQNLLKSYAKHRRKKPEDQSEISTEIPKLSSEFIGWRSTKPKHLLEKFGPSDTTRRPINLDCTTLPGNHVYSIILG